MVKALGGAARALVALLVLVSAAGSARAEVRYWIAELGSEAEGRPEFWTARLNHAGEVAATVPGGAALYTSAGTQVIARVGATTVVDLNDWGQVLGADEQGFFVYSAGLYDDLSGMTSVRDISNGGFVAGTTADPNDPFQYGHAAIWYGGSVLPVYELLRPLGEVASELLSVNSWGEGVGYWYDADGVRHPFFLYGGDQVRDVGPITEFIPALDWGYTPINDNGMVAGHYWTETGEMKLVYFWFGMVLPVDMPAGTSIVRVHGINERNDLFGDLNHDALGSQQGFIFTYEDQLLRETASLGGDSCTHGINNFADSVGHSNFPGVSGLESHTLFSRGEAFDLNTLVAPGSGFTLTGYNGFINDLGQILLGAPDDTGNERTVLLTPLPLTSIAFSGNQSAQGWYTPSATVTLNATDAATGVSKVFYRVDAGTWVPVTGSSATFQVSMSGTHRISYYAVDTRGHSEAVKYATVPVDRGGVVIDQSTLSGGTTGTPYSRKLSAHGGVTPYAFRLSAGALPTGLSLALDGTISGTPTVAGTYWFQVLASSRTGVSGRSFFSIEVLDPLQITTPDEVTGTGNIGLTVAGGKAPYAWSIDPATPLPGSMGLLQATIYGGTALALPPAEVIVRVTDANGATAAKSLSISFYPPITVTVTGDTTVQAGAPVALHILTQGGSGGWYWHNFDPPLPEGLVWGGTIWDLSVWGSVAAPGTYTFGVTATDGVNTSPPVQVILTVL